MKAKKPILLVLCALALVAASVFGTMAFLTDTDNVKNTFTVGKVDIVLDEAKVDVYGVADASATRVKANTYKLIPGHEYAKDPIVTFKAGSEASYLFVKIENGISAIEADNVSGTEGYKTIANQIAANTWQTLQGVDGVYYKAVDAATTDVKYPVFSEFALKTDAAVGSYASAEIVITAYAVQQDGFNTAADAWNATFGAPTT